MIYLSILSELHLSKPELVEIIKGAQELSILSELHPSSVLYLISCNMRSSFNSFWVASRWPQPVPSSTVPSLSILSELHHNKWIWSNLQQAGAFQFFLSCILKPRRLLRNLALYDFQFFLSCISLGSWTEYFSKNSLSILSELHPPYTSTRTRLIFRTLSILSELHRAFPGSRATDKQYAAFNSFWVASLQCLYLLYEHIPLFQFFLSCIEQSLFLRL